MYGKAQNANWIFSPPRLAKMAIFLEADEGLKRAIRTKSSNAFGLGLESEKCYT